MGEIKIKVSWEGRKRTLNLCFQTERKLILAPIECVAQKLIMQELMRLLLVFFPPNVGIFFGF